MEVLETIDQVEQFLVNFITDNFSKDNGFGDAIILPKEDEAEREFVGLLLTNVPADDAHLDGAYLTYSIVCRQSSHGLDLFTIRNKFIAFFQNFKKDSKAQALAQGINAFEFDIYDDLRFEINDDFYDSVFAVSVLI